MLGEDPADPASPTTTRSSPESQPNEGNVIEFTAASMSLPASAPAPETWFEQYPDSLRSDLAGVIGRHDGFSPDPDDLNVFATVATLTAWIDVTQRDRRSELRVQTDG